MSMDKLFFWRRETLTTKIIKLIKANKGERTIDFDKRQLIISFTNNPNAAIELKHILHQAAIYKDIHCLIEEKYQSYSITLTQAEYDKVMGQGEYRKWENVLFGFKMY